MMTTADLSSVRRATPVAWFEFARSLLDRVPPSLLLLLLRVGVGLVFWKSAQTKLANWDLTVQLFAFEYQVPVLSPEVAAFLGTAAELAGSIMLILGFGARFGALALLGVTLVIQTFVYPENWSEHLFWAAALLTILVRGAGVVSADHLIARLFGATVR
jgi:putative oxidoreductase